MDPALLHQPEPQRRKRAHSCLLEPLDAGEAASPCPKRQRHQSSTAKVFSWLRAQNTRSAPPPSCHEGGPRAQSATQISSLLMDSNSFFDEESQKSSVSGSKQRLVEYAHYRTLHCEPNGVVYREPYENLPSYLGPMIKGLYEERQSPQPDFVNDRELVAIESAAEPKTEAYYNSKIFSGFPKIQRDDRIPMSAALTPKNPSAKTKLSRPQPDALFGYPRTAMEGKSGFLGADAIANSQGLLYPFFSVEYKGDGPTGAGSPWVATNQCLGNASTCVQIADALNRRLGLQGLNLHRFDAHAFSVVLNGSEARLLVSWKAEDENIYTQKFGHFLTQDPAHIQEFRKVCRNIIDWGQSTRYKQIHEAINILLEHARLAHAAKAKSRPAPQSQGQEHRAKSRATSVSSFGPQSGPTDSLRASQPAEEHTPTVETSFASMVTSLPVASPPVWIWSNEYKQYYYVDASNTYRFQDGSELAVQR